MESKRKRSIHDGREFDKLFPAPSLEDKTEKKQADVEDTMALIQRTVPKTAWQTEKIAQKLKGRNLDETCRNIWHFVYDHIQYKRDKDGVEQVRSPRRTWWERQEGVDCDCYTKFICSILYNLKIPALARITKYPKPLPEIPRWQHVYVIVPRNGQLNGGFKRDDYITLDCVKDEYDSEQPFLEYKDYNMKLDYLDGIEQDESEGTEETDVTELFGINDIEPDNVDLADLAAIYDDEELGNIFKKIGGAVKKVAKKVGTVVKKVADKVGDGVRFLNRYLNPATILLRNGFLLAMKVNLLNVAGRLRYAYVTDAQAKEKGMNLDNLKKLRAVKDRAETVYWQAGGRKENLKKGILNGKGNKDKKVSLSGLFGLDEVYADADEYRIIHSDLNELGDLGDPVTGASLAAATSAVAAIGAALKGIKGLFAKGGKEEQAFQSETDNASDASAMTAASATMEEDQALLQPIPESTPAPYAPSQFLPPPAQFVPPAPTPQQPSYNETAPPSSFAPGNSSSAESLLPASDASRRATTDVATTSQNTAVQTTKDQPQGFIQKTTAWVKENPGKTLLIAGGVATGTYFLVKTIQGSKSKNSSVDGLPKKSKAKNGKGKGKGKSKVERKTLL